MWLNNFDLFQTDFPHLCFVNDFDFPTSPKGYMRKIYFPTDFDSRGQTVFLPVYILFKSNRLLRSSILRKSNKSEFQTLKVLGKLESSSKAKVVFFK